MLHKTQLQVEALEAREVPSGAGPLATGLLTSDLASDPVSGIGVTKLTGEVEPQTAALPSWRDIDDAVFEAAIYICNNTPIDCD